MSEGIDESTMEERLRATMEKLDQDHPRYQALQRSIDFSSAWIDLAEVLHTINDAQIYKEWGFSSTWNYCERELNLTRTTAQKLLQGYTWMKEEAPEYMPKNQREPDGSPARIPRPVPELNAASAMAYGYREMEDDRISANTYAELKESALRDGYRARALKREFKEAVPEHLRDQKPPNPLKHFKRALSELEKALEQLDDEDAQTLEEAAQLRDSIFALVSRQEG